MSVPNALQGSPARFRDAVSPDEVEWRACRVYPGQEETFREKVVVSEVAGGVEARDSVEKKSWEIRPSIMAMGLGHASRRNLHPPGHFIPLLHHDHDHLLLLLLTSLLGGKIEVDILLHPGLGFSQIGIHKRLLGGTRMSLQRRHRWPLQKTTVLTSVQGSGHRGASQSDTTLTAP